MRSLPFTVVTTPAAEYLLTDDELDAAKQLSAETQAHLQTLLITTQRHILTVKFAGSPDEQHNTMMHHAYLQGFAACLEELLEAAN